MRGLRDLMGDFGAVGWLTLIQAGLEILFGN